MGDLIKELRDSMNAEIVNYVDVTIPERETPYTLSTLAKYGNGKPSSGTQTNYTYFTMRTYVYNPSSSAITVTAAGTIPGSASFVSIAYLDKDGNPLTVSTPITPPGFCSTSTTPCRTFGVPCKDFVVVKFTVRVLNPAFGGVTSSMTIDTSIGSKTYAIKSGS